jgi:hypothetical protein
MYVFVQADHDCYLRLLYTQADGSNVQIFPNAYSKNNRIKEGEVYVYPAKNDTFAFEVTSPYGAELLHAFVSSQPFATLPGVKTRGGLELLSGSRGEIIERTRGIKVKNRCALYAEAKCVVNTLPRVK